jgi:hypothetical protein
VAPDSAYTLFTGPRGNAGDSADVTRFWVDQWGEPTRIRDAHRYETELTRADRGRTERPDPGDSAAIYFFVSLPSISVFQVVPSGDTSNLNL